MNNTPTAVGPRSLNEIKSTLCQILSEKDNSGGRQLFIGKVVNDEAGVEFVDNIRFLLQGMSHKLLVYGRHPNRKENGISRRYGYVRRSMATQLSLYIVAK